MSGIQKIITVALLLMSCAFVYASIDNNSTTKKEKARDVVTIESLQNEIEQLRADNKSLETNSDALEKSVAEEMAELNTLRGEVTTLRKQVQTFQNDLKVLGTEKGNLETQRDNWKKQAEDLDNTLFQRNAQITGLQKEVNQKITEVNDAKQGRKDAENALKNEKTDHATTKEKHKNEIAKKNETIKGLERKLSGQDTVGLDLKVTCSVLSVSRGAEFTLVSLNKGKADRLEVGVKFIVYNQAEEYKGTIEIVSVKEDTSIAKIIDEVEGKRISANDLATVKNW